MWQLIKVYNTASYNLEPSISLRFNTAKNSHVKNLKHIKLLLKYIK